MKEDTFIMSRNLKRVNMSDITGDFKKDWEKGLLDRGRPIYLRRCSNKGMDI